MTSQPQFDWKSLREKLEPYREKMDLSYRYATAPGPNHWPERSSSSGFSSGIYPVRNERKTP